MTCHDMSVPWFQLISWVKIEVQWYQLQIQSSCTVWPFFFLPREAFRSVRVCLVDWPPSGLAISPQMSYATSAHVPIYLGVGLSGCLSPKCLESRTLPTGPSFAPFCLPQTDHETFIFKKCSEVNQILVLRCLVRMFCPHRLAWRVADSFSAQVDNLTPRAARHMLRARLRPGDVALQKKNGCVFSKKYHRWCIMIYYDSCKKWDTLNDTSRWKIHKLYKKWFPQKPRILDCPPGALHTALVVARSSSLGYEKRWEIRRNAAFDKDPLKKIRNRVLFLAFPCSFVLKNFWWISIPQNMGDLRMVQALGLEIPSANLLDRFEFLLEPGNRRRNVPIQNQPQPNAGNVQANADNAQNQVNAGNLQNAENAGNVQNANPGDAVIDGNGLGNGEAMDEGTRDPRDPLEKALEESGVEGPQSPREREWAKVSSEPFFPTPTVSPDWRR